MLSMPMCFAQGDGNWKYEISFPYTENAVWTVDAMRNVIISIDNNELMKFTDKGEKKFVQSQKSLGKIEQITPLNTMKILCFSQDQQTICILDNTLTVTEDCLELSEYDVFYGTLFAPSGQSDKIWVFDQVNSTLKLIPLTGLLQGQVINNLKGIINADHVVQIIEKNNKLYVLDATNGVFILDTYGTLLQKIEQEGIQRIQIKGDNVLALMKDELIIYNTIDLGVEKVDLPKTGITDFILRDKTVYFSLDNKIEKYQFLLKK